MPEHNAFGLPNGEPLYSLWSRTIRNQKVALRKLLDNARFSNASIVTDAITGALRVWRADFDQHADELTGRMTPYLAATITRSGNAVRTRVGQARADDWFIRDTRRVQVLQSTVLDLCYDTIQSIHIEVDDKINLVRNRLISGEIDDGAGGWTELYSSLDDYFDQSSVWRALRIARTEGSRAANQGIRQAAEELDDCIGFEWLLAPGACQACVTAGTVANGTPKRVAKGDPFVKNLGPKITNLGDPLRERRIPEEYRQIFWGPLHPHCVLGETPIRAASIVSAIHAKYQGPIVRLDCSDGSRFAVTANHMLLTPSGFARAIDLVQGDDVVCTSPAPVPLAAPGGGSPDDDDRPSTAEEIFRSLKESCGVPARRVPVAPEYLHGDAALVNGDIDVVRADGLLRSNANSFLGQPFDHVGFEGGRNAGIAFNRRSDIASMLNALSLATEGCVGTTRELSAFLWGHFRHSLEHGLGPVSRANSDLSIAASDHRSRNAKSLGDAFNRFAGLIGTAKIIKINIELPQEPVSVYDFETFESMYIIGNGVASSNCRCSIRPIFKPLNGLHVEFHKPVDAGGQYLANTEEIKPVNLSGRGNFTDPGRPNVSSSGRVTIPKRTKSMPQSRPQHIIKPSISGGMVDAIGTKTSPGQVE